MSASSRISEWKSEPFWILRRAMHEGIEVTGKPEDLHRNTEEKIGINLILYKYEVIGDHVLVYFYEADSRGDVCR